MRLVRPSSALSVERAVGIAARSPLGYREVGAALRGDLPVDSHLEQAHCVLGAGTEVFARAVDGLRGWQAHRLAGVRILPDDAEVQLGTTVLVAIGTSVLAATAPCRIVDLVDEVDRWGFAYGTLRGHPGAGEEAFVVSIAHDGEVRFDVRAFSRPASVLTRLAGTIGRGVQHRVTARYLRGLARYVNGDPSGRR